MSAAVSNPSIPGMQTSSRMTAKSRSMTQRSAADSGVGLDDLVAERGQHGLQREALRGRVVDDEDRDRRGRLDTGIDHLGHGIRE